MDNLFCMKCGSLFGLFGDEEIYKCGCGNSKDFIEVPDLNVLTIKNRKIFLITGATGSGKNYLTKKLEPLNFENVPSVTTREPREGEIAGIDYVFIKPEEYQELMDSEMLCEHIKFGDHPYGVSKRILLEKLYQGNKHLILIVDHNGFEQLLVWFDRNHKLIQELNLELHSIFLDIDRVTRFQQMIVGAELGTVYSDGTFSFEVSTLSKDKAAFEGILNRLVRNGDTIGSDYKNMLLGMYSLFKSLEDKNLRVNIMHLHTPKEVIDFIHKIKLDENNLGDVIGILKSLEDQEIITTLIDILRIKRGDKQWN